MDKPFVTITYTLADGRRIYVEASAAIKELLEQSDRQIRSQRRQDRRYLDFMVRTDDALASPLLPTHANPADLVERKDRDMCLHRAIGNLTKIQQRRLCLYYFDDLSYTQIAKLENVSHRAIIYSVTQALENLRKALQE